MDEVTSSFTSVLIIFLVLITTLVLTEMKISRVNNTPSITWYGIVDGIIFNTALLHFETRHKHICMLTTLALITVCTLNIHIILNRTDRIMYEKNNMPSITQSHETDHLLHEQCLIKPPRLLQKHSMEWFCVFLLLYFTLAVQDSHFLSSHCLCSGPQKDLKEVFFSMWAPAPAFDFVQNISLPKWKILNKRDHSLTFFIWAFDLTNMKARNAHDLCTLIFLLTTSVLYLLTLVLSSRYYQV